MSRFGFTIRTRGGQRVENIMIIAASRAEAERRLRQMYQECSIVECRTQAIPSRLEPRGAMPKMSDAAPFAHGTPKSGTR